MDSNQTLPQIDIPRDMIHFGIGQPSNHLLPIKELEKAAAHCLSKKNSFFLEIMKKKKRLTMMISTLIYSMPKQ